MTTEDTSDLPEPEYMYRTANSARIVIKEAELLSGSNEFVRAFYELKASTPNEISRDDIDEDTEQNLLAKADDFILLTLAQYCLFQETLSAIFSKAIQDKNEALRIACLSNESVARVEFSSESFPSVLFARDEESLFELVEERLFEWVASATEEDLWALFRNRTISNEFVIQALRVEGKIWNALTEDNRLVVLLALGENPRTRSDYDGPLRFNGDLSYSKFHYAIWNLAKTLPVTRVWAAGLSLVFEIAREDRMDFDSFDVAKRWMIEESQESGDDRRDFLDRFADVRRLIYRDTFEPSYDNKELSNEAHLANPDVAYRASAYENLRDLTVDEIKEAYRKDGEIAVTYLLKNLRIWREYELREALWSVCREADRDSNDGYRDSMKSYLMVRGRQMEKNPSWFAKELGGTLVGDDDKVLSFTTVRDLFEDSKTSMRADTVELLSEIKAQLNKTRWKLYGALGFVLILVFFLR